MRKIYVLLAFAFWSRVAAAQDPQFTQIVNAPLYLNPAYSGSEQTSRAMVNHRGQWLGMPGYFVTTSASGDFYFPQVGKSSADRYFVNSGLGAIVMQDVSGASLTSTYLAGTFATEIKLNHHTAIRMGGQLGVGQRSFAKSGLVFGDMLTPGGQTGLGTQETRLSNSSRFYPDLSWGSLLYSPNWELGLVLNHINRPDESVVGQTAQLPIKMTAHFGYLFSLDTKVKTNQSPRQYVKPFVMYRAQGKYDQFDAGANIYLDPLVMGMWYRGLLLKQEGTSWNNQDAISLYIGCKWDLFEFGTGYDITISQLGTSSIGGSYELSARYLFGKPKSINGFTPSGAMGTNCDLLGNNKYKPQKTKYNANYKRTPKPRAKLRNSQRKGWLYRLFGK